MYEIKFEFSLIEERFQIIKITEVTRGINLIRRDFTDSIWNTIKDIGNALDAELYSRGGGLTQYVRIKPSALLRGSKTELKMVEFDRM